MYDHIKDEWGKLMQDHDFRTNFIIGASYCLIFPFKSEDYFRWIQKRENGLPLNDVVLDALPPTDVSVAIFTILYIFSLFTIYRVSMSPKRFLWLLWAFNIETTFRFLCIYFVPLEPPHNLINLVDPIAERLVYGKNTIITKDLFFSGHTSTMTLANFFLPTSKERTICVFFTVSLAFLLLLQHVHYTIDVVAAPFFTLFSIYLASKVMSVKFA